VQKVGCCPYKQAESRCNLSPQFVFVLCCCMHKLNWDHIGITTKYYAELAKQVAKRKWQGIAWLCCESTEVAMGISTKYIAGSTIQKLVGEPSPQSHTENSDCLLTALASVIGPLLWLQCGYVQFFPPPLRHREPP